jgi:hypothetical protein
MSKPTDELAAMKDAATKVSKQVDALQGELQKKLECQTIELRVAKLRTALKTLARSRARNRKSTTGFVH